MKIDPIEFAGLLCSRLCHDLLSPVGAMGNGLELLADEKDPDVQAQCLTLLEDSARATANKLKYFRLAFGSGGSFGEAVSTADAREALAGLFPPSKRITLGWMVDVPMLAKPATKILLNLAAIAGDALLRGGQLDIGVEDQAGRTEMVVRASGERLMLDAEVRQTLLGLADGEALSVRLAAAWLVRDLTRQVGGDLRISEPEATTLVFGVLLPSPA
ncbi:MAG: histidine phosphotransferase family protein [Chakrabartia sp.]